MNIVFLDAATVGEVSLSPISLLGDLTTYPTSTPQQALERVKDAQVLIINKIKVDKNLIDAAPKLALICEAATGVNNIDLEYAAAKGIPVRNVAGYSTDAVAQLTFTQILCLLSRPYESDTFIKSGEYSQSGIFTKPDAQFTELAGKTMGIIGMGAIGSRVASIAQAFGMKVVYFSTSGTSHCSLYPSLSLEDLLAQSDIVSIHAPLNERTKGLIGEQQLKMMKPGAIIVNMARGGIIDEGALAQAISEGSIGGAATDVFTAEPVKEDNPLLHTTRPERLLLTPHIGWASKEAVERLIEGVADNIKKGF